MDVKRPPARPVLQQVAAQLAAAGRRLALGQELDLDVDSLVDQVLAVDQALAGLNDPRRQASRLQALVTRCSFAEGLHARVTSGDTSTSLDETRGELRALARAIEDLHELLPDHLGRAA